MTYTQNRPYFFTYSNPSQANNQNYDDVHAFIYTENRSAVEKFIEDKVPKVYELQTHFQSDRLRKLGTGKFDGQGLLRNLTK